MSSTIPMSSEVFGQPPPDFGAHNMFAFGRETVYLSHLPMFMAPHDAQLILEVALEDDAGGSLSGGLVQGTGEPPRPARVHHDAAEVRIVHPLHPGSARPPLVPGEVLPRSPRARWQKHPRAGKHRRARHRRGLRKTIRSGRQARRSDLRLFGRGGELFSHVISEPPDFDQILSVQFAGAHPNEDEVNAGIEVVLPGRPNTATERLRDGTAATARGHVTGAHQFLSLEIADVHELYFEEGELMTSRGAFEPTELEIEAGFGD